MINQRIKEFRKQRGLSQQQLADMIGMDRASLSLMENGNRRVQADDLTMLAKALDCKISDFFEEDIPDIKNLGWNNIREGEKISNFFSRWLVRYKKSVPIIACYNAEKNEFYLNTCDARIPVKVDQYYRIPE